MEPSSNASTQPIPSNLERRRVNCRKKIQGALLGGVAVTGLMGISALNAQCYLNGIEDERDRTIAAMIMVDAWEKEDWLNKIITFPPYYIYALNFENNKNLLNQAYPNSAEIPVEDKIRVLLNRSDENWPHQ